jgi:hypothetical protein
MMKSQYLYNSYCTFLLMACVVGLGCFSKPPEAGNSSDASVSLCPSGKQPIAPNFVFASHRNGAVGRLNADALDDFVVHGTAPSLGNPNKTIPYVWVYMGDENGFDLQCPDEQYLLEELQNVGALFVDQLFTTSEPTGDLVVVGAKATDTANTEATLIWRHYTGGDSALATIDHNVANFGVPNWGDTVTNFGFISGLWSRDNAMTDTNAQLFWGGGNHVFSTEFNLLPNELSILPSSNHVSPIPSAASFAGIVDRSFESSRGLSGVRMTMGTETTIFYDDRFSEGADVPLSLGPVQNSSSNPHAQLDFIRRMSLGNNAAIFSTTNLLNDNASLEVATPDPVGVFKILSTDNLRPAFRDAFIDNADTIDPPKRNQMRLLVLQQKRFDSSNSNTRLVLYELEIANSQGEIGPPVKYKSVPIEEGGISDDTPPFMVVGNFENSAAGEKSVRVFHRKGAGGGTGVNCYEASLKPTVNTATLANSTKMCR